MLNTENYFIQFVALFDTNELLQQYDALQGNMITVVKTNIHVFIRLWLKKTQQRILSSIFHLDEDSENDCEKQLYHSVFIFVFKWFVHNHKPCV